MRSHIFVATTAAFTNHRVFDPAVFSQQQCGVLSSNSLLSMAGGGVMGDQRLGTAPVVGNQWEEAPIDPESDDAEGSVGEKIRRGGSVFLLSGLISDLECENLCDACSSAAGSHRKKVAKSGRDSPDRVRLPTISAAARAAEMKTPCAEALPEDLDMKCRSLLLEVLAKIDGHMDSIGCSLFDGSSLRKLFLQGGMEFASREPAVNIYSAGGSFLPHEDGHSLTVLIPLSSPDDGFTGGGTAFWSEDSRGARVVAPNLVLRPRAGTAMLFGGRVTHAGLVVETGERVVLVASFSLKRI